MGTELISALVGLFCTVASSIVTFFLTKRKYNTEVEAQQIENMENSFNVYKTMMEETVKEEYRYLFTHIIESLTLLYI
jgi:capsular polysaccharide biosynthesis protein